ncbi:MAG: TA system VapC family ribonuclease toxin [Acidobacteriota bacterium]
MILVDANLLVYAHDAAAAEHTVAKPWLEGVLNRPARVGLPWPSLLAFVRLVSNPAIVRRPVTPAVAWQRACEWLRLDNVWVPQPGGQHADLMTAMLEGLRATSRLVPDAHLAALAIEHGLTLCSTDGDFARFRGLRWENPLAV